MTDNTPILLLDNISKKISSIHPLIYLSLYILFIPIFAVFYFAIPSGFYAPYAQFEYNGQSDAYQTGTLIQSAIQRSLKTRSLKSPVFAQNSNIKDMRINEDMLYVQNLTVSDNSKITFDVFSMLWDDNKKGYIQVIIPVAMHKKSTMIEHALGYKDMLFRNAVRRIICSVDSPQAIRHNFARLSSALCVCGGLLARNRPTVLIKSFRGFKVGYFYNCFTFDQQFLSMREYLNQKVLQAAVRDVAASDPK